MVLDVLKYDLIGDISTCGAKVASAPEMPPPIALLQFRIFLLHLVGRAALHALDHITDRKLGRDRHHHMHVVSRDDSFDNLDAQLIANLPDNIAYSHPSGK